MRKVKNNLGEKISIDICLSKNIYSGVLGSIPPLSYNQKSIDRMIKSIKHHAWPKPLVFTSNLDETQLFPPRGNAAWINDFERQLVIIWFDDGEKNVLNSLEDVLSQIEWEKESEEFSF